MGQAQNKLMDDQLEDNLQDFSTVEENSVVTESTFTLVASDPNVHHNFSFSSPTIQDSHSQDFTNNSLASSLAGLTIHDNSNSDNKPAASVVQTTTVKNTVKENLNGLSKTVEDNNDDNNNNNNQITDDISTSSIGSITTTTSNSTLNSSTDLINKKSSTKEIKSTLADEAEYTIPPAIAEDVLREMLANKPSQDLLEELESPTVNTNGKGDNSSSKFKGDSVNHEKIGEFSEPSKNSVKKNNLLISSGTIDSPFPSKFTFPNIADKNFFVPNFSNPPVTTTPPSFSFGNPSELSLQNPFQSPSISSSNVTTANTLQQKEQQRRVTLQWHPPVLDKFSPVLPSKTPSITMSSSSIWPPSINTTSPTDTQFSNSNLLFPQFTTGSFKFDMNSKNNNVAGTQGFSNVPLPSVPTTTTTTTIINNIITNDDEDDNSNNNNTTTITTVPMSPPSTTLSSTPPILPSTASTSRKGMHSNVGTGRTTTLYVSAKPSIKTVSSNSGNMQTPLLVSPTSTMKKLPMKFGDISISSTSLTSATASAKGITISVNNSNSNSSSSSTIQTSPPPRGFIHNATNAPTQRQIKELPRRAKFRPISKGNNLNDENSSNNNNNNNNISKNEPIINGEFNIKNEMVITQPSLPVIPPSPLFSFSTPNSEDDDDFDAEEDDGNNVNGHADWLDNANNKKKRKALQTVGGSSTTSGGVGGVIKTLTAKERANPLRRVERRSTQRSNIKSSSNCDSILPFDSKSVSKELDGMRPPQTTFDFSFKSISEKSAAATAASVNAASAKRLAAVSPIQVINSKNDPFPSPLFLQQSQSTVTTVVVPNNTKKKVSTKRAAPSSALFKTEDVAAVNNNHVHPQFAKTLKSLPPPPPLAATPKRLPNAANRKKNKKKAQATANNNQNIQNQHPPPQHPHQHHSHHHQHNHHSHHQQQDDTSSTSGSVDIQPISNNNLRRKIKFPEKNGDWICMFCEYKLYYGDGRRSRRRPKNNMNANHGDGGGGFNTPGDGGIASDKALAT